MPYEGWHENLAELNLCCHWTQALRLQQLNSFECWFSCHVEISRKSKYTACSVTETNPSSMRKRKKKKKAKDMTENYFRKRITLHYFSHQFWLVFISISSRLVETWPIPSLWDATQQSFLITLRYSHAYSKAEALGLLLWMWRSAMPLLRPQLPGRGVGGIQPPFVFKINIFIHHLNAHIINSYAPAAVLSLIFSSPPCNWLTLLRDLLGKNVWDLHFPRKWSNHSLLF